MSRQSKPVEKDFRTAAKRTVRHRSIVAAALILGSVALPSIAEAHHGGFGGSFLRGLGWGAGAAVGASLGGTYGSNYNQQQAQNYCLINPSSNNWVCTSDRNTFAQWQWAIQQQQARAAQQNKTMTSTSRTAAINQMDQALEEAAKLNRAVNADLTDTKRKLAEAQAAEKAAHDKGVTEQKGWDDGTITGLTDKNKDLQHQLDEAKANESSGALPWIFGLLGLAIGGAAGAGIGAHRWRRQANQYQNYDPNNNPDPPPQDPRGGRWGQIQNEEEVQRQRARVAEWERENPAHAQVTNNFVTDAEAAGSFRHLPGNNPQDVITTFASHFERTGYNVERHADGSATAILNTPEATPEIRAHAGGIDVHGEGAALERGIEDILKFYAQHYNGHVPLDATADQAFKRQVHEIAARLKNDPANADNAGIRNLNIVPAVAPVGPRVDAQANGAAHQQDGEVVPFRPDTRPAAQGPSRLAA